MTSSWAIMAARFRRSSTSKVNFSVLTKRWAPTGSSIVVVVVVVYKVTVQ